MTDRDRRIPRDKKLKLIIKKKGGVGVVGTKQKSNIGRKFAGRMSSFPKIIFKWNR